MGEPSEFDSTGESKSLVVGKSIGMSATKFAFLNRQTSLVPLSIFVPHAAQNLAPCASSA